MAAAELQGPALLLQNVRAHHGVQRRGGQRAGGVLLGSAAGGDTGVPHLQGAVAGWRVSSLRGRPACVLGVRRQGLGAPVPAPLGDPPWHQQVCKEL